MAKYKLLADQWDQVLSKPTEPFRFVRHRKGATVELAGTDEARLLRIGAVEPARRSGGKAAPKPAQPAPQESAAPEGEAPSDDDGDLGGGSDDQTEGPVDKPAKTAPVAAWRDYAISQGHDPDEAAEAARADLIAQYG